ncbi:MAG: hypothetical protein QOG51_1573 [Verrucomicrobiota bacterium]|jgi:hypothetical protein
MNPRPQRIALFVGATFLAVSSLFAAGERNTFDPTKFSTGKFHGCAPTGIGSDPYLNSLKNRDKPPATARLYTVTQVMAAAPKLPSAKVHREKWTAPQQDLAARWESQAVTVEGFLLHVVKEGKEACNCGSTQYVDHHMWLAPTATASRARAMVVEISPRAWAKHPTWATNTPFNPLVKEKTKVRMTGWLTFDQEHNEQVGKTRGTLWEVHPVTQVQVLKAGKWIML